MTDNFSDDMPVRELMVKVIERWFPDDDAPYDRVDELLDPVSAAGFEVGITTDRIEGWLASATELEELKAGTPGKPFELTSDEAMERLLARARDRVQTIDPTPDQVRQAMDRVMDVTGEDGLHLYLEAIDADEGREPTTPEEWVEWGRWDEDDGDEAVDKRRAWQVGMMRQDDGTYDVYLLLSDPHLRLGRLNALKLSAALKVAADYSVDG